MLLIKLSRLKESNLASYILDNLFPSPALQEEKEKCLARAEEGKEDKSKGKQFKMEKNRSTTKQKFKDMKIH